MNRYIKTLLAYALPLVIVSSICSVIGKYERTKKLPDSPLISTKNNLESAIDNPVLEENYLPQDLKSKENLLRKQSPYVITPLLKPLRMIEKAKKDSIENKLDYLTSENDNKIKNIKEYSVIYGPRYQPESKEPKNKTNNLIK